MLERMTYLEVKLANAKKELTKTCQYPLCDFTFELKKVEEKPSR